MSLYSLLTESVSTHGRSPALSLSFHSDRAEESEELTLSYSQLRLFVHTASLKLKESFQRCALPLTLKGANHTIDRLVVN